MGISWAKQFGWKMEMTKSASRWDCDPTARKITEKILPIAFSQKNEQIEAQTSKSNENNLLCHHFMQEREKED